MTPTRRVWLVLDAKDACFRLVMEQRTRGRVALYWAVRELWRWLDQKQKHGG